MALTNVQLDWMSVATSGLSVFIQEQMMTSFYIK